MHILLYALPTPFSLFLSFLARIHMYRYALFFLYAPLLISTYCRIFLTFFHIFPHTIPIPLHALLISSPISFSYPFHILIYPFVFFYIPNNDFLYPYPLSWQMLPLKRFSTAWLCAFCLWGLMRHVCSERLPAICLTFPQPSPSPQPLGLASHLSPGAFV